MKNYETGGRIVLLGDQGVGKTSIVKRFVRGTFNMNENSTIGASYFSQDVFIDDRLIKFQIWDTAGQEAYRSLCPIYYRNADVGIIVFDVTRAQSFKSVETWIRSFKSNCKDSLIILVGNKNDCEDESKEVSLDEVYNLSENMKTDFMCVSAKTGEGIQDMFLKIGCYIKEKLNRESNTIESMPKIIDVGKKELVKNKNFC